MKENLKMNKLFYPRFIRLAGGAVLITLIFLLSYACKQEEKVIMTEGEEA